MREGPLVMSVYEVCESKIWTSAHVSTFGSCLCSVHDFMFQKNLLKFRGQLAGQQLNIYVAYRRTGATETYVVWDHVSYVI